MIAETSNSPLYVMASTIVSEVVKPNARQLAKRISDHIYAYIIHCRPLPPSIADRPPAWRMAVLEGLYKWGDVEDLTKTIKSAFFAHLKDSEKSLFLGHGICAAVVLDHLSKLFKMEKENFLKASSFPLKEMNLGKIEGRPYLKGRFYEFQAQGDLLEESTKKLRFIQATYIAADALTPHAISSLESKLPKLLKSLGLESPRRIPETGGKLALDIQELIGEMTKLAAEAKGQQGYLLGIGDGASNHALALHLQAPFHFMDPNSGIGVADTLADLAIFLIAYLTEKYSTCQSFAFLEFTALKKTATTDCQKITPLKV